MQNNQKNKRSTYQRITEDIRQQLIKRVIVQKQNIKTVVNQMNVNISTAKAILKVYQEEGRVGKKKKRDKVINIIQTYSFYTVDGLNVSKLAPTVVQEQKKSIQSIDSKEIENSLKGISKQRAQELINEIIQKHNASTENAQIKRNITDMSLHQQQLMLQQQNVDFTSVPGTFPINSGSWNPYFFMGGYIGY